MRHDLDNMSSRATRILYHLVLQKTRRRVMARRNISTCRKARTSGLATGLRRDLGPGRWAGARRAQAASLSSTHRLSRCAPETDLKNRDRKSKLLEMYQIIPNSGRRVVFVMQ